MKMISPLLLMLVASPLDGQILNLRIGGSIGQLSELRTFSQFTVISDETTTGVSGGVYLDFPSDEGVGFRTGALWVRKGYDGYAETPVLARIGSPDAGVHQIFALMAPSVGFRWSDRDRGDPVDVSAALGVGYTAPLTMGLTHGMEMLGLFGLAGEAMEGTTRALLVTAGIGIPLP